MKCENCDGTGEQPNQKLIGHLARVARVNAGLSLRATARVMGIHHSYLIMLENGRRRWSQRLKKINHNAVNQTKP